jgi:hypothetical protein
VADFGTKEERGMGGVRRVGQMEGGKGGGRGGPPVPRTVVAAGPVAAAMGAGGSGMGKWLMARPGKRTEWARPKKKSKPRICFFIESKLI